MAPDRINRDPIDPAPVQIAEPLPRDVEGDAEKKVLYLYRVQDRLKFQHNAQRAITPVYRADWQARLTLLCKDIHIARRLWQPGNYDGRLGKLSDSELDALALEHLTLKLTGHNEKVWDADVNRSPRLVIASLGVIPDDPVEDFTTYTETDAPGKVAITSTVCTVTGLDRDEDVRVARDMGAGHFVDFSHNHEFNLTATVANASYGSCWALATDHAAEAQSADDRVLRVQSVDPDAYNFLIHEKAGVVQTIDGGTITKTDPYWATTARTGSTLTCTVYTDDGRANTQHILSLDDDGPPCRWVYAVQANNVGGSGKSVSFTSSNLDLGEGGVVGTVRRYYESFIGGAR